MKETKRSGRALTSIISEARLVDVGVVAAGLALAGFYWFLFARFNAAPPFQNPATMGSLVQYAHYMDGCRTSVSKISITGWLAKPGVHRDRHATTALIRDESDGRMFVMKTDVLNRKEVTAHLNNALGDTVDYDNSGFSASLNLHAASRGIREGRVYIAYDEGGIYMLLPMPCTYSSSP